MWLIINDSFRNVSDKISYCCIIASRTNQAGLVHSFKSRRQFIGLSLVQGTFKRMRFVNDIYISTQQR
jgi:hypothetical protein